MPPTIKSVLAKLLGHRLGSKERLHLLEQLGEQSTLRQGASEVELRELSRKSLLMAMQSYTPATQVAPPSFVTAALKHTAVMLSQFPIERCVDFLAFQADAAVTSIGTRGDGAKRRVDYGLQQTDWMDTRSKLPMPRGMQAQAYVTQRVFAGLLVWEVTVLV